MIEIKVPLWLAIPACFAFVFWGLDEAAQIYLKLRY
jgi:hypothetical protein